MIQEQIKELFSTLSLDQKRLLLGDLRKKVSMEDQLGTIQQVRKSILDNRQGNCPHCGNKSYFHFGKDKGSQRYKCKGCKRTFTEYTGTWMAGIHKKEKIEEYIQLMLAEKSLDKIKQTLKMNKKTAFDWRHNILSAIEQCDKSSFTGITESDETFFSILRKEPGKRKESPRKEAEKHQQGESVKITLLL